MRSSQNVVIVKIPFLSRAMAFLIIAFVPMGKGICDWQQRYSIGSCAWYWGSIYMSKRSLVRKYTH